MSKAHPTVAAMDRLYQAFSEPYWSEVQGIRTDLRRLITQRFIRSEETLERYARELCREHPIVTERPEFVLCCTDSKGYAASQIDGPDYRALAAESMYGDVIDDICHQGLALPEKESP